MQTLTLYKYNTQQKRISYNIGCYANEEIIYLPSNNLQNGVVISPSFYIFSWNHFIRKHSNTFLKKTIKMKTPSHQIKYLQVVITDPFEFHESKKEEKNLKSVFLWRFLFMLSNKGETFHFTKTHSQILYLLNLLKVCQSCMCTICITEIE